MADKCVLAFSGGLDTSVCVAWIKETYGWDVIALTVNVGQGAELDGLEVRAEAAGASDLIVLDATEEFVTDFCFPALKANALYEGRYPLVSALSRPLIARHLVRVAAEQNAVAVGHGCTGKGNDQVRFETSIAALGPHLKIVAPIRETGMQRDQAIAYAAERNIPVVASKEKPYSVDENVWGRAIEGGILEDPWTAPPPKDVWEMTSLDPQDEPTETVVSFERGIPVAIDGESLAPLALAERMNQLAGAQQVGRIDMIENRLVGIKSREVYEVPGSIALITAHRDLEDMVLERDLGHFKQGLELKYSELVYNGLWFSPLKRSLDAFIESTQAHVTGDVRLMMHNGVCRPSGRRAPKALYDPSLATYGSSDDAFRHDAAAGFIHLWAQPVRTWAAVQGDE